MEHSQNTKFIRHPENDSTKRFVLGKPGKKNLLAICLNPSTADEAKLDPTSSNVEKIAHKHGYEG